MSEPREPVTPEPSDLPHPPPGEEVEEVEEENGEEEKDEPRPAASKGGQTIMKSLLFAGATAAALALGSSNANAIPIAGGSELSLNGSDTFTGAVGGTTFTINFINPGNVGGQSGSFSELPNCTGCVTMISSLTQASTNFQLYSLADPNSTPAGDTSSLTAGSITSFSITAGVGGLEDLSVSGPGTLNLTGFDPTPGFYTLTTQGPSGMATVTFSNTSIATSGVPEPASLGLLGSALMLMGFWWRWRRN